MNVTLHDVQFADHKMAWSAGSVFGRASIREGEADSSEVILFFWSADHCQQLADELTELANTMRQIENGTAAEDASHG